MLVTQPVHQHSYETAVALDGGGLLHTFMTGLYDTQRGLASRRWLRTVPRPLRTAVERELGRRRHPELRPDLVRTISRYHALEVGLRRGSGLRCAGLTNWTQCRFDAAVARTLVGLGGVQAVHAFEGAALETFRAAGDIGLPTVLDVPSASEYYRQAILAEGGDVRAFRTDRTRSERAEADFLLVPSEFVERCLVENGVPQHKIVRIPFGVNPSLFLPPKSRDDVFRALFVGRIGLGKGVAYLLEAWSQLRLPKSELVLVGRPDSAGELLLNRYGGICRHVSHVPKAEVPRWYRAADIFVFPTLADGSAYVSYEALASALPVVTTPNCGSVVRDGVDGFVVPPRDVDALCDRIGFLYENRDHAWAMGASGRRRVCAGFTWQHYAHRLTDFYRELLGDARPRRSPDALPPAVTATWRSDSPTETAREAMQ